MVCLLFGAKPLAKPGLGYCESLVKKRTFSFKKMPFKLLSVQVKMSQTIKKMLAYNRNNDISDLQCCNKYIHGGKKLKIFSVSYTITMVAK